MNNIFVIKPYKLWGSVWVFDDEVRGAIQEPFVGATNLILDSLTAKIKKADKGFLLYFSDAPLKENHISLSLAHSEMGWSTYQVDGSEQKGSLCPFLLKFWPAPTKKIYAYAQPLA